MSSIMLEAEARTDLGKGASRRLRRLENKYRVYYMVVEKHLKPFIYCIIK